MHAVSMTKKSTRPLYSAYRRELEHFPEVVYHKNAVLYRLMANPKRLHMLNLLAQREMTVAELAEALHVRMANVSQHLSVLRANKFVEARRAGTNMYYRITDSRIVAPCRIFKELHHL